jgi:ribA/ribD-fused uncharacterized protein
MRKVRHITAFFGARDAFSNWHPCHFSYHGVDFTSVERFMMFSKAKLFNDNESAVRIFATDDPKAQKAIGRKVKGFEVDRWFEKREGIVFVGCREKFAQDEDLRAQLLESANTHLVEASPYDVIWGVGLGENDPLIADAKNWRGQNLLGIALMRVREGLSR